MLRYTLRSIVGYRIRFVLTSLAVVVGVAFVVGSLLISGGLRATFEDIVATANQGVDAEVRGTAEFDDGTGLTPPIGDDLVDAVAAVDGVAVASPSLTVFSLVPIDADGEPITSAGPPIISVNATTDEADSLSDTVTVEGSRPGPGQFAADVDSAQDAGFVIGDTYDVITDQGRRSFEFSGTFTFGEDNALAGAKLFAFDLADLQSVSGYQGAIQTIRVAADGSVDPTELLAAIGAVLPDGVEVVSGEQATAEDVAEFGEIIDIFGNILLGFAGVALFVAAFLINNVFNIILGQRVREMALLRSLGASARQIRISVLGESVLMGILASAIGLGLGVVFAVALVALFDALGFSLPGLDIAMSPVIVVTAFVIGVGVTALSAISPSRRASRIPPVAGLQQGHRFGQGEGRRRLVIGGVLGGVGAISLAAGLLGAADSTSGTLGLLVPGAMGVFIGVTLLSPSFVGPVANLIGAPLRHIPWLRVAGQLARENAARNTERTAAAAGALMIGLALVGMAAVTAESLKATFTQNLTTAVQADYFVSTDSFQGFGTGLAQELRDAEEFDRVSAFRFGRAQVNEAGRDVLGVDLADLDGLIDPDVTQGSLADGGPGTVALHTDPARDLGVGVGDTLTLTYANGDSETLEVIAVYDDSSILGNWVIDLSSWTGSRFGSAADLFIAARVADGVDVATASAVLDRVSEEYPQARVENQQEFRQSQEDQLNSLLAIINGMLVFAILIALLGIAITLALSVFERTREIGLLRAVGALRVQVRRMVRWEAAIVSVFGALLGLTLGVIFGLGVVTALPEAVVTTVAVPWLTLASYVVLAALLGLAAAAWPAWRAGRMNVLDAISHL